MKILNESSNSKNALDIIKPYLLEFGKHELSYSLLQKNMDYFVLENIGIIGFRRVGNKNLVLGDPLSERKDYDKLLTAFFDKEKNVSFYQSHKDFAICLNSNHGFYANEMGVTTELSISEYDLKGASKQNIRTGINKAKKENIEFIETSFKNLNGIEFLVDNYISNKTVKNEISFLARELVNDDEFEVRKFIAKKDDNIIGLAVYSPMFKQGEIIGYLSDIMRTDPNAPSGLTYAFNLNVLNKLKEERMNNDKLEIFSLGLSPYAHIHDESKINNPLTTIILTTMYQFGNSLYNAQGLARNKLNYDGKEIPTFYCSKKNLCISELISVYHACNINVLKQVKNLF